MTNAPIAITNIIEFPAPSLQVVDLAEHQPSDVQRQARIAIQEWGVNAVPVAPISKAAWAWQAWQHYQAPRDALRIKLLFSGQINIALLYGRISGNLAGIDCDGGTFAATIRTWLAAGLPLFASRSSEGNGCIFFKCIEGELQNLKKGSLQDANGNALPDVELWGNHRYQLIAPSIHPDTAQPYRWFEGNTTTQPPWVTLEQLTTIFKNATTSANKTASDKLSQTTIDYLQNGAADGNRNNSHFAAACELAAMVQDGAMPEAGAILRLRTANGRSHPPQPDRAIAATWKSAISKPRDLSKGQTRASKNSTRTQGLVAAVQGMQWGRGSIRDVMMAHVRRSEYSDAAGTYRASARELGKLAQCNWRTALLSTRRLIKLGFIEFAGTDAVSKANKYRLTDRIAYRRPKYAHYTGKDSGTDLDACAEYPDALKERGSLGSSAIELHTYLLQHPDSAPKAISEATGRPVTTVRRLLVKLRNVGMANNAQVGQWQAIELSHNAMLGIAVKHRTVDKAQAREDRTNDERTTRAFNQTVYARLGDDHNGEFTEYHLGYLLHIGDIGAANVARYRLLVGNKKLRAAELDLLRERKELMTDAELMAAHYIARWQARYQTLYGIDTQMIVAVRITSHVKRAPAPPDDQTIHKLHNQQSIQ